MLYPLTKASMLLMFLHGASAAKGDRFPSATRGREEPIPEGDIFQVRTQNGNTRFIWVDVDVARGLPDGWTEHNVTTEDRKTWIFNEFPSVNDRETGRSVYHNSQSKRTQWSRPNSDKVLSFKDKPDSLLPSDLRANCKWAVNLTDVLVLPHDQSTEPHMIRFLLQKKREVKSWTFIGDYRFTRFFKIWATSCLEDSFQQEEHGLAGLLSELIRFAKVHQKVKLDYEGKQGLASHRAYTTKELQDAKQSFLDSVGERMLTSQRRAGKLMQDYQNYLDGFGLREGQRVLGRETVLLAVLRTCPSPPQESVVKAMANLSLRNFH